MFCRAMAAAVLCSLSFAPKTVEACACCAELGWWSDEVEVLRPAAWADVRALVLSPGYVLNQTVMLGEDPLGVLGDTPPARQTLTAETTGWRVVLRGPGGEIRLRVPRPRNVRIFGVDLERVRSLDPSLYKELRFQGRTESTRAAWSGRRAVLVLQGTGNTCETNVDRWKLRIEGPQSRGEPTVLFVGGQAKGTLGN